MTLSRKCCVRELYQASNKGYLTKEHHIGAVRIHENITLFTRLSTIQNRRTYEILYGYYVGTKTKRPRSIIAMAR